MAFSVLAPYLLRVKSVLKPSHFCSEFVLFPIDILIFLLFRLLMCFSELHRPPQRSARIAWDRAVSNLCDIYAASNGVWAWSASSSRSNTVIRTPSARVKKSACSTMRNRASHPTSRKRSVRATKVAIISYKLPHIAGKCNGNENLCYEIIIFVTTGKNHVTFFYQCKNKL